MIKLTQHDDGKQYLAIDMKDGTQAQDVYRSLVKFYPAIISTLRGLDSEQILVEIMDGVEYSFSLLELKDMTCGMCIAEIYTFVAEWSRNRIWKVYKHQVGGG